MSPHRLREFNGIGVLDNFAYDSQHRRLSGSCRRLGAGIPAAGCQLLYRSLDPIEKKSASNKSQVRRRGHFDHHTNAVRRSPDFLRERLIVSFSICRT